MYTVDLLILRNGIATLALLAFLSACSQPAPAPKPGEDKHEEHAEHEEHEDHDEHTDHADEEEEHDHAHEAKRGGALVELGDHAGNIEVLLEADAGRLTFYLMDAHAENPVRSAATEITATVDLRDGKGPQSLTLAPRANALTGETIGDTSEFFVESELLKGAKSFDVSVPKLDLLGATFENISFPYPEGKQ
jgi:hypothetical protein